MKTRKYLIMIVCLFATMLLTAGCAKKRPVLYPNPTYKSAGATAAKADIDECIQLAADHGHATDAGKNMAASTGKGAVTGAVVGGAVGAVTGRPGRGAAAGAAGGGAGGLMRGAWKSGNPDEIERRFVEQCLRDKGYQVIGWK
ncbi:MAG: cell envelope biogenesis protein OmpA [Desulfobacterales bacterium]